MTEELSAPHPAFRVIVTASKSVPLKDWLSDEHANMFFPIASLPMSQAEETFLLQQTGCPLQFVDPLVAFAEKYRASMTSELVQKNRKLGTRALVRIARRLAKYPDAAYADLHALLSQAVLAEFLPAAERMGLADIFEEMGIQQRTPPVSTMIHGPNTSLNLASSSTPPPLLKTMDLSFLRPPTPTLPMPLRSPSPCLMFPWTPKASPLMCPT